MSTESLLVIGLMSGTSLDGVDGVLARCKADGTVTNSLAHCHETFDPTLRAALLRLQTPGSNELHDAAVAANRLAEAYASVCSALCAMASIDASSVSVIGAHGQTVRHRPDLGYTVQLNNPALLAELAGMPVVSDFRSRDIAAGGQGAPLVPAFHQSVFGQDGKPRVIVNLGGICNISILNVAASPLGFDIGPCNVLLDAWVQEHLGEPFDRNGAWADMGECDPELLNALLTEPYFALAAPKSSGRDLFNPQWLNSRLGNAAQTAPEDVQRTLVELVAVRLTDEISRLGHDLTEVVLCGGGTFNLTLRESIARHIATLNSCPALRVSDEFGVPADQVEALAFAWLAALHVGGIAGNLPSVTGARGGRVLGSCTPR
jgi:anhydro-N-acetylmuramic acid kinase